MYSISILNPFHRRVLDPCADHRCNAEPRLLPLRAMSLSCIVSQYGTAGVPRIPGAVGQLLTFLLAFGPDGGGKNGLHPNARNLRVVTVQLVIATLTQSVSAQETAPDRFASLVALIGLSQR